MWSTIAFLGFVVLVVGLVALVRPIPRVWLPTRRRAGLATLCGFALFVVGAVIDTIDRPENEAVTPAENPTAALRQRLEAVLADEDGELRSLEVLPPNTARDTVIVEWDGAGSLGGWYQLRAVLQAVHESGLGDGGTVWVRAYTAQRDDFGQEQSVQVLGLLYEPDILARINWEEVRPVELDRLASDRGARFVHPDLRP